VQPLTERCVSSKEITLTDQHINMLERQAAKFQAADPADHEKVIIEAADLIKRTWNEAVEFDRDTVTRVCALSDKLGYSHIFLAYSLLSV